MPGRGVAASTLVVAALFSPLRRRVAGDRRFSRARYEADKTLAAFRGPPEDTVVLCQHRDYRIAMGF